MKKLVVLTLTILLFSCASKKVADINKPLYELLTNQNDGGANIQFYEMITEPKEILMLLSDPNLKKKIKQEDINETLISNSLTTAGMPDPELLIRTSGEHRISNFLLWQISYSELYFTDVLWPDFRREDLYQAIISYQNRERRFGKTSEQLKP